jgi:hypothetical protein
VAGVLANLAQLELELVRIASPAPLTARANSVI